MTAAVTGFFNFAGWTSPDEDYYGPTHSGATVGSGSLTLAMDGSENLQLTQPGPSDILLNTYRWLHGSLLIPDWDKPLRATEVLYTESTTGIAKGPQLFADISGSGFVVGLFKADGSTVLGTGSTEFSFDTEYEYRIEENGSSVVLDFGVAGSMSEEVNAAYNEINSRMDVRVRFRTDIAISDLDITYKAFGYYTSPDRSSRQRTITVLALPHNDDTPQVDEYTTISSGTDKSAMVDDYVSGGADGDGTTISSSIAKGETEGQTLVTPNISLSTVQALKVTLEHRLQIADKEAVMGSLIGDGSSGEHSHVNIDTSTAYHFFRTVFTTDANGNPWTQARLDNVQYGHEITVGPEDEDVVNVFLTAVHAEAIGSTADAPPVTTVAPQVHHQRHHNMAL